MASEMVVRVGTAINHAPTYGVRRNKMHPAGTRYEIFDEEDILVIETYDDRETAEIRAESMNDEARARAAIEAMRTPTPAILKGMTESIRNVMDRFAECTADSVAEEMWPDAITEALKEPASSAVRREGE